MLSLIPNFNLTFLGIDLCVILAGWQQRLLGPPRLSAGLNSFVYVANSRAAASISSFNVNDIIAPKAFCCPLARS